jgi:hypothetical protein
MSWTEEIRFLEEAPAPAPSAARGGRRKSRRVFVLAVVVVVAALAGTFGVVPALHQARRDECSTRLKRLGSALHAYHEAHGHFPAPATRARDGKALLSWRVAILPQLGEQALYDAFHQDEPWDSLHNLALLSKMPAVFACPAGWGAAGFKTGYLVVVGPKTELGSVNTPFEPGRGADLREITDGTSSTLLVAETRALVPWTKPDDLSWERDGPPPAFGSAHPGGFHGLFADTSTRFIKPTVEPAVLKAILTINGGEANTA